MGGTAPDGSELLDVLLEYVRQVLDADHACLSESSSHDGPITVLAAAGRLTHPELWPGMGVMDETEFGYDGSLAQGVNEIVAIYRRDDPATPGVTAFLGRIGAAFDVTIRVHSGEDRLHFLELYYCDPDAPFGPDEIEEASRLAPMLAAVFTRDRLAAELLLAQEQRTLAERALDESERRRLEVLEEMLRAEAEARARIAADLHDDTIQVMTASQLGIERAAMVAARGDTGRTLEALDDARETMVNAIERARRMTFELRPPLLSASGLTAAVSELAQQITAETGLAVELDLRVGRHPSGVEDLAYRTVREALANVRKHAGATCVRIELLDGPGSLDGLVRDDGRGFDVRRAADRRVMRLHMGLDTMRERVSMVGGRFDVVSTRGEGTDLRFSIPVSS